MLRPAVVLSTTSLCSLQPTPPSNNTHYHGCSEWRCKRTFQQVRSVASSFLSLGRTSLSARSAHATTRLSTTDVPPVCTRPAAVGLNPTRPAYVPPHMRGAAAARPAAPPPQASAPCVPFSLVNACRGLFCSCGLFVCTRVKCPRHRNLPTPNQSSKVHSSDPKFLTFSLFMFLFAALPRTEPHPLADGDLLPLPRTVRSPPELLLLPPPEEDGVTRTEEEVVVVEADPLALERVPGRTASTFRVPRTPGSRRSFSERPTTRSLRYVATHRPRVCAHVGADLLYLDVPASPSSTPESISTSTSRSLSRLPDPTSPSPSPSSPPPTSTRSCLTTSSRPDTPLLPPFRSTLSPSSPVAET